MRSLTRMKSLAAMLLAVATLCAGCSPPTRPLPTVAKVDLRRYGGLWFEIARLPNPFQRSGAVATAEYTPQPDGTVKVRNTELRANGNSKAIEGSALAVAGSGDARLKVKFGGLAALAPVPQSGNYWIIALEPDYSAALVGTPDRKFLWLLARSQKLPAATRTRLVNRAAELGFPVERLLIGDWSRLR